MKKLGLYNELGEKVGWVEFDEDYYYNLTLWDRGKLFKSMTPMSFWNYANHLGLLVGSF